MSKWLHILFFCLCLLHPPLASAGDIRIEAVYDETVNGLLKVILYDKEDDFLRKALTVCQGDVVDGIGGCEFSDIPGGEYAISAYLDLNGNGKLDTGIFGIPEEPIGASNDAPADFGPPDYDDARFDLPEEGLDLKIRLSCPMGCIDADTNEHE